MEKTNLIKLGISGIGAYLSAKLGILFPILMLLMIVMIFDYCTGMLSAGYNDEIQSRKGMWGVVKKALYGVTVAVAMIADWIIINVAKNVGRAVPFSKFFGLIGSILPIFYVIISILENLIKMEVPIPPFLKSFVNKFKIVVEGQGNKIADSLNGEQE